ncbi:hypothetical protein PIB30_074635 [Stylosanthes scabra]|uniref:Uncharacterized protein n=1 Tax=Stylosanthes scabra TaxID=79078 RepID=A0ABU6VN49_9FABA|nr:hypothetical protein [Stylosanthes scabra]
MASYVRLSNKEARIGRTPTLYVGSARYTWSQNSLPLRISTQQGHTQAPANPRPAWSSYSRQKSSSGDPMPMRQDSMPRRGKLKTETEAAVSHA